jgi:hypothetical protein
MSIITLLIYVVILGLAWWLIITYVPFPAPGKVIVNVIFVVILLLLLLSVAGIDIPLGRKL